MKIRFAKPWIGLEEVQAVNTFLLNQDDRLTDGSQTQLFESEFCLYTGARYSIATSSCMAALHLSYLALGIGQGDEVIVPAMTHVATAHAVELVGARPVFLDCFEDGNGLCDFKEEVNRNRKLKGVSIIHYIGNISDHIMTYYINVSENYGLRVVEDCALALGTKVEGKHIGLFGNCGCFSFYPTKHITTGEGGMFVTNDYKLYEKAKIISRFGKTSGGASDYDIGLLGSNFRMSEVQAVLGRTQLKKIDKILKIRHRNLDRLKATFPDNICGGSYCAILHCNSLEDRDRKRKLLKDKAIETSVYYPKPVPALKFYATKYGYAKGRYPNAIRIAETTIALPIGPHITNKKMDYMIKSLKEII